MADQQLDSFLSAQLPHSYTQLFPAAEAYLALFPPPPPIVIGLVGRKRVGKDTVGDYLVKHYGFTRVAFADALKKVVAAAFGLTDGELDGAEKETVVPRLGVSARKIMQEVGMMFRDDLPKRIPALTDTWIRAALQHVVGPRVVITDIRFPNEYACVRALPNSHVWEIRRGPRVAAPEHVSEAFECPDPDALIDNNGTKEALCHAVASLCLALGL
jgi:hypothetical protein